MGVCTALLLLAGVGGQAPDRLQTALARLGEEAEVFSLTAVDLTGEETLQQRARRPPPRFRPRLGAKAHQPPQPEYQTREIVSEYGFAVLKESPGVIHEFRQVVSVDGRKLASPARARESLARGLKSGDDRIKRQMLDKFRRHGLASAAADFGQLILLFTPRRQADYCFRVIREDRLGADAALVVDFQQKTGSGSLLIFEGKTALYQRLDGEVWMRQRDGLPLRITLRASRTQEKVPVRDEAAVDYVLSPHGVLVPASVVHRQWAADQLLVENRFSYSAFRKFAAETQVTFD